MKNLGIKVSVVNGDAQLNQFVQEAMNTVILWNKVAGNDLSNEDLIPAYQQFSKDEYFGEDEFLAGINGSDPVMVMDGLCDLVYTTFYWLALVCNKLDVSEVDIIAIEADNHLDFGKNALNSFIQLVGYLAKAFQAGADVDMAFDEVTRSNFSKFIKVADIENNVPVVNDVLSFETAYIETGGRYGSVSHRIVGDYIIMLASEDIRDGIKYDKPKIVKPSSFQDVSQGVLEDSVVDAEKILDIL